MEMEALKPRIEEIFQYFHGNPELSWQEVRTTEYIVNLLRQQGCRVRTFEDCTGVVGEIGSGKPVVGLRADLDALWQEVDGAFRANHSCGHDAHMTMAIGALLALKQRDSLPGGTLRFIFQPAEEKAEGALKMIEKGVLDEVTYLYGIHLRPIHEMPYGSAAPAILHGAGCFIHGRIIGESAHGAHPHLGINAIEVGAMLVQALQGIHMDPTVPHSVKMTRFQAGGSGNIIPGTAEFNLDIRSQTNEVMDRLRAKVESTARSLATHYGVRIETRIASHIVAAQPDPEAQAILASAIKEVLGPEHLNPPVVTPGGEDFHFYTHELPHLKGTMLGLGCDLRPGLHHPHMTFERDALTNGIAILANALVLTLQKAHGGNA